MEERHLKLGPETLLDRFGAFLARRLTAQSSGYQPFTPSDPQTLRRVLQPGDILLIEGNQYLSSAIKYLTQSTWSHAALYVGDALPESSDAARARASSKWCWAMDASPRHLKNMPLTIRAFAAQWR